MHLYVHTLFYMGFQNPSIQQSNGPMNSVGHAPPPPLVRTNNTSSTSAR